MCTTHVQAKVSYNYTTICSSVGCKSTKNGIFLQLAYCQGECTHTCNAKVSYNYTIKFIELFLPDSIVDIGIIRDRSAKVCNAFKAGVSSVG